MLRRVVGAGEDLGDLVQESLVRILEKLDSFRGESAFTTWATGVAIRVAFTERRRRRHREAATGLGDPALGPAAELADRPATDPGRSAQRSEMLADLRRAIRERLTERQRTVILAELRGLPTIAIAEHLGTNQNALYKLAHDARKKLRAALLEAGHSAEAIHAEVVETTR